VSQANSLVGANPNDRIGNDGLIPLSNGNYVVQSSLWNGSRGAVTWVDGSRPFSGGVSATNSLVGTAPHHLVGLSGVFALRNGNYVVDSANWNGNRGAVTWGDGTSGVTGTISATNSLLGTDPLDAIGEFGITRIGNGNYVVRSPHWNGSRGAVTWG